MKNIKLSDYISPLLAEAVAFDKTYFPIPIRECGEQVVDFKKVAIAQNIKIVFNNEPTLTGQERLFMLRKSLIDPFISVAKDLKKINLILRIEYMYRRLEDQKASYERSVRTWKEKLPNADRETILEIAGIFVASTPDTAGHLSGAAIDIILVDTDFNPVDMGVPYVHAGPESAIGYTGLSEAAIRNRKILLEVMEQNGFANYPYEYWHFSMDDKIAARVQGKSYAKYGPVIYEAKTSKTRPVANANIPFNVDYLF